MLAMEHSFPHQWLIIDESGEFEIGRSLDYLRLFEWLSIDLSIAHYFLLAFQYSTSSALRNIIALAKDLRALRLPLRLFPASLHPLS